MPIIIKEITNEKGLKDFVKFQYKLYKGDKYWVPALQSDELMVLSAKTNPVFKFCDVKFLLAYNNDVIVGRIAAIIHNDYNHKTGKKMGRFSRLEFINDLEVVSKLLKTAEEWLKEKSMDEIQGPLGFSNLDTQGMLVEGFDRLPSIGSVYHKEYYKDLLPECGYKKEIDWLEFRLTVDDKVVNRVERGSKLIQKRYGIEVIQFKTRNELKPYATTIFEILNDAFDELPYVSRFSDELIQFYATKYMKFLNPEFVKIVKMKGEIIGFVIGMPSLSEAMQKAGGKLFPFGFYHIKKAIDGNSDTMDQMLTGVKKEHMSTGAGVILMAEIHNQMIRSNMKYIETTGIFETNSNAISNWKSYDHIQHKRKRCWIKKL
jgi:hypothetical protein